MRKFQIIATAHYKYKFLYSLKFHMSNVNKCVQWLGKYTINPHAKASTILPKMLSSCARC